MNRNRIVALVFAFVILVFGAVQVGAQGTLTLEGLANRLNRTDARVAAIETAIAPTLTPTPRPTRTPRPTYTPRPTATRKPTLTPTPIASKFRVSADQIFTDYSMYEGMTVEVSGEVIKKSDNWVELHVPGWFSYFICWLSPNQENLPLVLKNRQYVVLQGDDVSKHGNTVSMKSCTFVSPSPVELNRLNATRVASTATARSVKATATVKAQKNPKGCKCDKASCYSNGASKSHCNKGGRKGHTRSSKYDRHRPSESQDYANAGFQARTIIPTGSGAHFDWGRLGL